MAPPITLRGLTRVLRPNRSDLDVALRDHAARRAGYCNALADTGDLDTRPGGYTHWRCDRRRGHTGRHRGINYTWTVEHGSCRYDPVDSAQQRADAEDADTVDVVPLPGRGNDLRLDRGTYGQRVRRLAWDLRINARRGWGPPTPGQVLGLLCHPGAAVAGLSRARMLEETVGRVLKLGGLDDDTLRILGHQRSELAEQLDRAGALR